MNKLTEEISIFDVINSAIGAFLGFGSSLFLEKILVSSRKKTSIQNIVAELTSIRDGLRKTIIDSIEKDLVEIIPEDLLIKTHHLLIFHGRYRCHSRNPECERCSLINYCKYIN